MIQIAHNCIGSMEHKCIKCLNIKCLSKIEAAELNDEEFCNKSSTMCKIKL